MTQVLAITTMRNEAAYILEWLAYHRGIGFTDFLIYTNDCEDGTVEMLDHLAAKGVLHHEPNPRKGKKTVQWRALNRAVNHPAFKAADWVMVMDVDEFLVVKHGGGHLVDLFNAHPDADGFAFSWRMFGNGGKVGYEDRPVTQRFTRAAPATLLWPWRAVQQKALWRNDGRYKKLGVHRPLGPVFDSSNAPHWLDDRGQTIPGGPTGTPWFHLNERYSLAQINHYALGSVHEFLIKVGRGRPNRSDSPIGLDYWIERNFNQVEDHNIARHAAMIDAGLASFFADTTLAALHHEGVRWRQEQISAALSDVPLLDLSFLVQQISGSVPCPPQQQQLMLQQMFKAIQLRIATQQETEAP